MTAIVRGEHGTREIAWDEFEIMVMDSNITEVIELEAIVV